MPIPIPMSPWTGGPPFQLQSLYKVGAPFFAEPLLRSEGRAYLFRIPACVTPHCFVAYGLEALLLCVCPPRQTGPNKALFSLLVIGKSDDVAPLTPGRAPFFICVALEFEGFTFFD